MKGLIGQVGKTNIGKGGADMRNIKNNPNQVMGKLQQMINPQMMAQLGGAGNVMNMMKEMGSNPQM